MPGRPASDAPWNAASPTPVSSAPAASSSRRYSATYPSIAPSPKKHTVTSASATSTPGARSSPKGLAPFSVSSMAAMRGGSGAAVVASASASSKDPPAA